MSSDSVDMLIKKGRRGVVSGGRSGRGWGQEGWNLRVDGFLRVSRLLQRRGGSMELGSANHDLCRHHLGAAKDCRKGCSG